MLLFRRRQSRLEQPTLWLPDEMLIDLQQQAAEHSPEETGGMLLGWRNGTDILITTLVGPGPRAKQSRDQFTPDGAWQQHQLEAIYRESARTVTYLGDWHSHPHSSGRPSKRDRETAIAVAGTPDARAPQPLSTHPRQTPTAMARPPARSSATARCTQSASTSTGVHPARWSRAGSGVESRAL